MNFRNVSYLFLFLLFAGTVLERSADAQLLRRRCCTQPCQSACKPCRTVCNPCRPLLSRLAALRSRLRQPCCIEPTNSDCCVTDGDCLTCDVTYQNAMWQINSTDCADNCYCPVPISADRSERDPVTCAPIDDSGNQPSRYLFQVGFGPLSGGSMPTSGAILCRPIDLQGQGTTHPVIVKVPAFSSAPFTMKITYNPNGYLTALPAPQSGTPISINFYSIGLGPGTGMIQQADINIPDNSGEFVDAQFANYSIRFTRN